MNYWIVQREPINLSMVDMMSSSVAYFILNMLSKVSSFIRHLCGVFTLFMREKVLSQMTLVGYDNSHPICNCHNIGNMDLFFRILFILLPTNNFNWHNSRRIFNFNQSLNSPFLNNEYS